MYLYSHDDFYTHTYTKRAAFTYATVIFSCIANIELFVHMLTCCGSLLQHTRVSVRARVVYTREWHGKCMLMHISLCTDVRRRNTLFHNVDKLNIYSIIVDFFKHLTTVSVRERRTNLLCRIHHSIWFSLLCNLIVYGRADASYTNFLLFRHTSTLNKNPTSVSRIWICLWIEIKKKKKQQ